MPEATLPKLVIYPQSDADMPSTIYGTRIALQTLSGAINNALAENQNLNTKLGRPSKACFKAAGEAYKLEVFISSDDFIDSLPSPFFDENPNEAEPLNPIPLPSVVRMCRDVLAMAGDWIDYSSHERALRVINAYQAHKVRNRVTPQMLLTAMRKQPSWYQDAESHLNMAKALNAVIDLDHPDTLVLRSDLDAAHVRIKDLEHQVKQTIAEALPF